MSMLASLAKEAEALRLRSAANEERMQSLQRKVSDFDISDRPVAAPRRSLLTLPGQPSEDSLLPSAPVDSRASIDETNDSDESLADRLAKVEAMNRDWLAYNDQREIFVQEITSRHHETTNQLRQALEEVESLKKNQTILADEARRKSDVHLSSARNEIKRKEELNDDLLARLKQTKEQLKLEQKLLYNATQKNEKLEIAITNLETMNKSLNKFLDKKGSKPEAVIFEDSINKLSNKLDSISFRSGVSTNTFATDISKRKAPPVPPLPKLPDRMKIKDRRSLGMEMYRPDAILRPMSPKTAKSRRSVDSTAISCENCGRKWPVSQHSELLKHLDECDVI